jgi:hypothetical protein
MHILLTGDSWINGAYDLPDLREPTHPGLEWFLQHESGHRVTNLAIRGNGNHQALTVLEHFIRTQHCHIDLILFCQCCFMRDFFWQNGSSDENRKRWANSRKLFGDADNFDELIASYLGNHTYPELTRVAGTVPVFVIGGNTRLHSVVDDHFDNMGSSISKLVRPDMAESYFDRSAEYIEFEKAFHPQISVALRNQELDNHRYMLDSWKKDSEYFYHQHARLKTHEFLYQKIIKMINL